MVDQDAATQQMVKDAAINFPDKPQDGEAAWAALQGWLEPAEC